MLLDIIVVIAIGLFFGPLWAIVAGVIIGFIWVIQLNGGLQGGIK